MSESYSAFVRTQFGKSAFGKVSLWVVAVISAVAIFADFIANEKPIIAHRNGELMLPVFKQYGVMLGIAQWQPEYATANWHELQYDWSIFPPIPYDPSSTDKRLVSLKDRAPSGKHWLGTDDIGRDVMSGMVHGSRYALSIGFVAMSIALSIGIVLGAIAGFFGGKIDVL